MGGLPPRARFVLGVFVIWSGLFLWGYHQHQASEWLARQKRELVAPQFPTLQPPQDQIALDVALDLFHIQIPFGVDHPAFDKSLEDRGLTIREAWGTRTRVKIGPSAFASWALLGSTLAHELEVHTQQHFFMISVLDWIGLDGTGRAERLAYNHELKYARRFGMTPGEYDLIDETVRYYYPEGGQRPEGMAPSPTLAARVSSWLVRYL
jgi:hypothetical protein